MRAPLKYAAAALLALPLALPSLAEAQSSQSSVTESVSATATILAGLDITADGDLQFGDLLPGVARTVLNSDPDAAQFAVSGAPNASVSLLFTSLPSVLVGPDRATLSIAFSGSAGGIGTASRTVASSFNPATAQTRALSEAGALFIMLGGTATPGSSQPAGTYTGTITLQVSYSGS